MNSSSPGQKFTPLPKLFLLLIIYTHFAYRKQLQFTNTPRILPRDRNAPHQSYSKAEEGCSAVGGGLWRVLNWCSVERRMVWPSTSRCVYLTISYNTHSLTLVRLWLAPSDALGLHRIIGAGRSFTELYKLRKGKF